MAQKMKIGDINISKYKDIFSSVKDGYNKGYLKLVPHYTGKKWTVRVEKTKKLKDWEKRKK